MAQISDIHLGNPAAPNARGHLLAIVESINEERPDAVIVTGDIGEISAAWTEVRNILSGITSPILYIPGNHDTNGADIALYRSVFGQDYYKLELKGVTVFALNTQLLGNFSDPRADIAPPMDPFAQAEGEKMLLWLSQQASTPGKVSIAIQHVPLFFSEALPVRRPYWVIGEPIRSRELAEFRRLGVRHVFAGHWHMQDTEDEDVQQNGQESAVTQHVAPSVAWPLFKSQPGFLMHSISAKGAVSSQLVAPETDLAVKMSSPASVGSGETATYSVTVTNHGPRIASGVTVTDTLPGGQSLLSASPSQGSCAASNPVVCEIGTLSVDGLAKVTIAVQTRGAGSITNSVAVAANQYDFEQANNQVSANTTVENRDFLLEVSPATATVPAGGSAAYTVSVIPESRGFHEQISLTCPGLSAALRCSFTPAQFVPDKQRVTSMLTVSVAGQAVMAQRSFNFPPGPLTALAITLALLTFLRQPKKSRRIWLASIFLLVLGCGGGAKHGSTHKSTTTTITVTGSAASIQRSATATLVVQ